MLRSRFHDASTTLLLLFFFGITLSACASSTGDENASPRDTGYWDEIWRNHQQEQRDELEERWPEETPQALLQRAHILRAQGDIVSAAITVRQATLRDPWLLEAHELYQDIQLERGQFATLHDEYLRFLGQNIEHGAALYLFMRPTLLRTKRTKETLTQLSPSDSASVDTLYRQATSSTGNAQERFAHAAPLLNQLFDISPLHIAGHRLYQDLALQAATPAQQPSQELLSRYADLQRQHEVDGDAVYLYERIAGLKAPVSASLVDSSLRSAKAIASGLPGYWLFYGMGVVAVDRASRSRDPIEREGLLKLAILSYNVCVDTNDLISDGVFGRAVAHDELRHNDLAAKDYELALSLEGNTPSPGLITRYASVMIRTNQSDKARELLQHGMQLYPDLLDYPWLLGRVEQEAGNMDAAILAYEQAYSLLDPESNDARQVQARIQSLKER